MRGQPRYRYSVCYVYGANELGLYEADRINYPPHSLPLPHSTSISLSLISYLYTLTPHDRQLQTTTIRTTVTLITTSRRCNHTHHFTSFAMSIDGPKIQ